MQIHSDANVFWMQIHLEYYFNDLAIKDYDSLSFIEPYNGFTTTFTINLLCLEPFFFGKIICNG